MYAQATAEAPIAGEVSACLHCQLPLGSGVSSGFCCRGCEAVYGLLRGEKLQRFYGLRQGPGAPVVDRPAPGRDMAWLSEAAENAGEGIEHYRLDVQGLHCAGCVWLMQETFARSAKGRILVNPALGSVDIWLAEASQLRAWLDQVERFGYRFGPALKENSNESSSSDGLLLRLAVCIAIAVNVMLLSAALYLGLDTGRLYEVVRGLAYALSSAAVLIGGPVFFRSALAGLRQRILHLDVPIALGIALAYAGSSWAFWTRNDQALYLDSVSVFIALMLLGRYLQERVLVANRRRLLASDGSAGLRSRRIREGQSSIIESRSILRGDVLRIAAGDLVPVPATLLSPSARISTEWISGESRSHAVQQGASLAAGSFNAGREPFLLECRADFAASPLEALLRPGQEVSFEAHQSGLMRAIASYYVVAVLGAALLGFAAWMWMSGSLSSALAVATAVLVVSCPCAFGIASPLAHELVQAQLRRRGFYLRSGDFLERVRGVKTVVFDKTGTLSTGAMQLARPQLLETLDPEERDVLAYLAARSSHPASEAIAAQLPEATTALGNEQTATVEEHPGLGIELQLRNSTWRLGRASWALGRGDESYTSFAREGKEIARIDFEEESRSDAKALISTLARRGLALHVLSGDSEERVQALCSELGIAPERAHAGMSPEQKRSWLAERDRGDLLFLGDGINDSLAAQQATCSGTPALDRPFMAAHCDFYLGTEGLSPIAFALDAADRLAAVLRRNLGFAILYNIAAVALALAGLMQPWMAAILMPASSIAIVLATGISLSSRRLQWTS